IYLYYLILHTFIIFFYLYILHFLLLFFFFNDTATTEIYTLSLHDALPIFLAKQEKVWSFFYRRRRFRQLRRRGESLVARFRTLIDRKSTRLNSSHVEISYAVFCLKKKKKKK